MIPGMGAVGLVVEEEDACAQRGMRGIARLLGSVLANSAYHGTRLDTEHIAEMMDRLVSQVEREHGLDRKQLAGQTVFVSHETYTPARGGSAAAEIKALRRTFGDRADEVVVANTKGYTGHPMGVGIEDAVAVKMLERETVPPIPNLQEPDPELGRLNLSRGGHYDVRYALRLAAGFGSQVTMTLMEKIPGGERIADRERHQAWPAEIAGRPDARLEVVNKTLRIHDEAAGLMEQHRNAGAAPAERQQPAVEPAVTEKRQQVVETGAKEQPPVTEPAAETTEEVTATTEPQVAGEEAGKPVEAAAAAVPGAEEVREKILAIVAEKTGYPPEMLELDLDLEADLGIDTVKQAEMFSEVRAAFGIPKQDDLKLSDYPTLGHIIEFALGKLGEAGGGAVTAAGAEEQVAGKTAGEEVTATTEPQVAGEEAGKPVEAAAAAVPGAEEVRE
ncbi:MAG: beta-ketoacyl synthase, partial [Deltaproteobacteria bacterium]